VNACFCRWKQSAPHGWRFTYRSKGSNVCEWIPAECSNGRVDYFCESSIQLEYGPSDEVQFIGVSWSLQPNFTFKGLMFLLSLRLVSLMAASTILAPRVRPLRVLLSEPNTHALGC
jgi:hypothetical protein